MGFPGEFFGDFFSGISLTYEPSDPVKRTSILFTSQYVAVDPCYNGYTSRTVHRNKTIDLTF